MIPRKRAVLHPSLVQVYSGDDLSIILEMFEAFEEYWLSGYMYEFGLDTPLEKFAQLVDYHKTFQTVAPHV